MPIRFDPLRELDRLAQSLGQALGRPGPVRVARSDEELRLDIDLPGVKAEDIELDVGADRVVVRAVRRSGPTTPAGAGDDELQHEYGFSDRIDLDGVSADYEDGVLTVRLPRRDGPTHRRVPVRSRSDRPGEPPPAPPAPSGPAAAPPGPAADPPAGGATGATGGAADPAPPPAGEQANPLPTS